MYVQAYVPLCTGLFYMLYALVYYVSLPGHICTNDSMTRRHVISCIHDNVVMVRIDPFKVLVVGKKSCLDRKSYVL